MYATLTLPNCSAPSEALPVRKLRVRSADDLRNALRQGRDGVLVLDGSDMDRVLHVDAAAGIVELQAGASWETLSKALAGHGIALDAFAATPGLPATVGEAMAQAHAGPDGLPVTAHVRAIALFTADGELRRADAGRHGELFRMALGGHGVVGVLYSLTLSLDTLRASAANALAPVEMRFTDPAAAPGLADLIECLVPPESLGDFLSSVRALAAERRVALHSISVRRYRPETARSALCWSRREWAGVEVRFGLKATIGASVAAAEVRRALLAAALELGGAFPLRDLRDASRAQLLACYPAIEGFLADKRRGDSRERLQNGWYRRAIATLRSESCPVRWEKS